MNYVLSKLGHGLDVEYPLAPRWSLLIIIVHYTLIANIPQTFYRLETHAEGTQERFTDKVYSDISKTATTATSNYTLV